MDSDPEIASPDEQTEQIKRPRRTAKPRGGSAHSEALERLRQAKQSGTKNKHVVMDEKPVYDLVSEDKYSKMVEQRQNDDWVVDDGIVEGYADDGREIFEDDEFDDYEDRQRKSKSKDKASEAAGSKKNPNIMKPADEVHSGNIKSLFEKSASSMKKVKKPTKESGDLDNADDILGDILGELRQQPVSSTMPSYQPKPAQFSAPSRPMPTFSALPEIKPRNVFAVTKPTASVAASKPVFEDNMDYQDSPYIEEMPKMEPVVEPVVSSIAEDSSDMYDAAILSSIAQECEDVAIVKCEATTASQKAPAPQAKPSLPSITTSDNAFVTNFADQTGEAGVGYSEVSVDASNLPLVSNSSGEKVMRVFWYDAYEDTQSRSSNVYIFGKVYVESSKRYASVCMVVKNVERRIYVLPREGYTFLDCREEISQLLATKKIMRERYNKRELGHVSTFDDPEGIPVSAQYLEVRYPAEYPSLPSDLSGKTFSKIFGTSSTPLEILFVEKKMKGPCWIDVKNPLPPPPSSAKVSWSKFEVHVAETRNISVYVPPPDAKTNNRPPDFTLLALSFRFLSKSVGKNTSSSSQHNHSEIVSVTGLIHSAFRFDRPAPNPPFQEQFTIITQPSDVRMPLDFKDAVKNRLPGIQVNQVPNERALLSLFIQRLSKYDPDIIVAHDFNGYQLDTLLNRFANDKVPSWSRIGALVRPVVPRIGMPSRQHVTSGRLVCDILHIAKELVRLRSYDLTELSASILSKHRVVFEPEHVALAYANSSSLIDLLKTGLDDADSVLRIAYELSALPLANQLSQICGCLLSRVMAGGRSERNEWLLLHAFAERGFIPPEKQNPFAGKGRRPVHQADAGEDSDEEENAHVKNAAKGASKRKPAYAGGLVLEPKKGFYDKFILLLDFNSLYPSIIQEFNICFTTVGRQSHIKAEPAAVKSEPVVKAEPIVKAEPEVKEEQGEANVTDEMDEISSLILPSSSVAPGVLPSVLKTLVQSRHEVKKLMAAPNVAPDLMVQYDIRQRALKLTANSMYGCLGFTHSRFYARPLASLITSKGREILGATRDLVTNMGLDVIYGDTDSVMVNSNCTSYEDVMKMGQRIKAEVNKHYRLLEIEVDGVFKTMLLLKKKKYAALAIAKMPDGQFKTKEELRGLDIVRRDWCPLSRNVGGFVVSQILLSDSMERVVEIISNKLTEVAQQVTTGGIEMQEFAIARQLARDPDNYADAKSLPHVLVAQRLNKLSGGGRKFRAGDTIFYVICEDSTGNIGAVSHVQRAYHPDELTKPDSKLKIDTKYYLAQQIHPVVSRLCEPIPGLDAARIAELLGLDPAAYRRALGHAGGSSGNGSSDIADGLLAQFSASMSSLGSNESRFSNCDKFHFPCPSCSTEINIDRVFVADESKGRFSLMSCPHCKCEFPDEFYLGTTLIDALKTQIGQHITRYYAGWYMCEEPACAYRTCRLSARLYHGQPLCPACEKAPLVAEYSERQLYEQLLAYKLAFDVKPNSKAHPLESLKFAVREAYDTLCAEVQRFLSQNLYAVVNLNKIFQLCMPVNRIRNKPVVASSS